MKTPHDEIGVTTQLFNWKAIEDYTYTIYILKCD